MLLLTYTPPEPIEPLPEGASAALAREFNAAMERMQADLWAAFGGGRVIPNVRVGGCGCGVVHTCNKIA